MHRFYFHIIDRLGFTPDEAGAELEDRQAAYRYALESARSIMADDMRRGHLSLDGRIDVTDAARALLFSLDYRDAFHEQTPASAPIRIRCGAALGMPPAMRLLPHDGMPVSLLRPHRDVLSREV